MMALLLFLLDVLLFFAIYLIVNTSLNMQLGYAGIPNFGLVLAITGGAYVVGVLPIRLSMLFVPVDPELASDVVKNSAMISLAYINPAIAREPWLGVLIFITTLAAAAAAGALLGFISAYPAIRLRADYLAITLLALGEILFIVGVGYDPLVGGPLGVVVPDPWAWASSREVVASLTIIGIAVALFLMVLYMTRTPFGRALKIIRDNEIAASVLGIDVSKKRMEVMVVSSALCGIAGALYAFYTCNVCPYSYGRFEWTFLPWLMVVLGGAGNNMGVLVGTAVFVVLRKFIIYFKHYLEGVVPFDVVWLDHIFLGMILLLILLFKPRGLLMERPAITTERKDVGVLIRELLRRGKRT